MFRFFLSETEPPHESLVGDLPGAGGVASFEGRVRNHNEGRQVLSLEYSAYPELALNEGARIMAEAAVRFGILGATAVHRTGHLAIGELAVKITVYAGHRQEAFAACSWILDEIKSRLPIWKKEHYAEGDSAWVSCAHEHKVENPVGDSSIGRSGIAESVYYDRQMRLEGWGQSGQERLRKARVLLVGAGGLGCPAALYLAGAGIGTLGICDGDRVSADNLHRQVLFGVSDIGKPKADCAAAHLRQLNPLINIIALPVFIDETNAGAIIADWDLVVEGTDTFSAKFLVHDFCRDLGKPLVHASIYKHEAQFRVFPFCTEYEGPCLRCLYPEAPQDGCTGTCAEVGVPGPVTGIAGAMLASATINLVLGMPTLAAGSSLYFDSRDFSLQRIAFARSANCPGCSSSNQLAQLPLSAAKNQTIQKSWSQLEPGERAMLLDIREASEIRRDDYAMLTALGAGTIRHYPLSQWAVAPPALPPDGIYLIFCAHGVRSHRLATSLSADSARRYISLLHGIEGLRPQ